MRVGVPCVALLALAGCGAESVVAAYQLRNVNPMTTDAAALRVAVEVPQMFEPRDDLVSIIARYQIDGGPAHVSRFALVPARRGSLEMALSARLGAGDALYVYQLKPDDVTTFDAFRAQIDQAEQSGKDSTGSLTVDTPVCSNQVTLPERIPVTVHIKPAEVDKYVRVSSKEDILQDTKSEDLARILPRCS